MSIAEEHRLSTAEAAGLLGVKPETLYAYVSRGLLSSYRTPGKRGSRFDAAEVRALAARRAGRSGRWAADQVGPTEVDAGPQEATGGPSPGRRGGRRGGADLVIESALTLLEPAGHLWFRGWDAVEASSAASYERVAEWLWHPDGDAGEPPVWQARPEGLEVARSVIDRLPTGASLMDRMRVAVAAAAATDPMRHDRRPEAVVITARSIVATVVDCLSPHPERVAELRLDPAAPGSSAPGIVRQGSIAGRLWPALSTRRPRRAQLAMLNAALVLLSDHELAASTLAARVAASTWADPYLVVEAGMGVLEGPLHGGAAEDVRAMIAEVCAGLPAAEAVGRRLRQGEAVPGLGHRVYTGPDPRAAALLQMMRSSGLSSQPWAAAGRLLSVTAGQNLPAPNIDFALAVLADTAGMVAGATEAIFAVARCAGWIAHALEEYPHRLRFRPRASYVGPPPGGEGPAVPAGGDRNGGGAARIGP